MELGRPSGQDIDENGISTLADRLRQTRTACRRFLLLWAMSNNDSPLEDEPVDLDDPEQLLRTLKNSANPDWSFLCPGNDRDD